VPCSVIVALEDDTRLIIFDQHGHGKEVVIPKGKAIMFSR
jgi:hypothetical protein